MLNSTFDRSDSQLQIRSGFTALVSYLDIFYQFQYQISYLVYMCYSDETCTTTCPATGRKRRDAETALGISRRDTSGVQYQENGLPGRNFDFSYFPNGLSRIVHDILAI